MGETYLNVVDGVDLKVALIQPSDDGDLLPMWLLVDLIDRRHVNAALVCLTAGFDSNELHDDGIAELEVLLPQQLINKRFHLRLHYLMLSHDCHRQLADHLHSLPSRMPLPYLKLCHDLLTLREG